MFNNYKEFSKILKDEKRKEYSLLTKIKKNFVYKNLNQKQIENKINNLQNQIKNKMLKNIQNICLNENDFLHEQKLFNCYPPIAADSLIYLIHWLNQTHLGKDFNNSFDRLLYCLTSLDSFIENSKLDKNQQETFIIQRLNAKKIVLQDLLG